LALVVDLVFDFRQFGSDGCCELRGVDLVPARSACEVGVLRKRLPRVVARAIQIGDKSANHKKMNEVGGTHGLYGGRRNLIEVHGFSTPRGFALLLFPCVELGETAMVVMAQTPEVVK